MINKLAEARTLIIEFDGAVNSAHEYGVLTNEEMKEFKRNNFKIIWHLEKNIELANKMAEMEAEL